MQNRAGQPRHNGRWLRSGRSATISHRVQRGGRRGFSAVAALWPMVSIAHWSALDALHDAHFRRLWLAGLCVNVGRWLDFLVLGWLALELTGSPFMVGLAAFCRFAPMIVLGLFTGLLIDRVPRGRLMLAVQAVNLLSMLLLALL